MRRWKQLLTFAALLPLYLVVFAVVHELGHTAPARLLGDPEATFYLVRIGPGGQGVCLGCAIVDHTKLSAMGNVIVSLGGLLLTQLTAISALFLLRYLPGRTFARRLVAAVALGYAFLDVPVQVIQGLLYNLERHTWPTGVDLMDAMLLISEATGLSSLLLKLIVAVAASAYLYLFWRAYKKAQQRLELTAAADAVAWQS
jgi:hypothetical protein